MVNRLDLAALLALNPEAEYSDSETMVIVQCVQRLFPSITNWPPLSHEDPKPFIKIIQKFYGCSGINLFDFPVTMFGLESACVTGFGSNSNKTPQAMLRDALMDIKLSTHAERKAIIMFADSIQYARFHTLYWLNSTRVRYCLEKLKWLALHSFEYKNGIITFAQEHYEEFTR
jgi:hypothetical protein